MDPLTDARLAIGDLVCEAREWRRKFQLALGVLADLKDSKVNLEMLEILPDGAGFTLHPALPPGAKAIAAELLAKARERNQNVSTNGTPEEIPAIAE